jgi:hypothetical protein
MTSDGGVRLALEALQSDGAALTAAADAAEEALGVQRGALDLLVEGWRSDAGAGAVDFVARNCAAAADIVTALRGAAVVLGSLSENLGILADAEDEAPLPDDVNGDWYPPLDPSDSIDPSDPIDSRDPSDPRDPSDSIYPMDPRDRAVGAAYGDASNRLGELPMSQFEAPMPPPAVPPGVPALPNLGGALTGLIAQIAEALGSYSELDSEPEPETEPEPDPEPEPEPEPEPDPTPDPEPEPDPEPTPEPEPEPEPTPEPEPEPEPTPEPAPAADPGNAPAPLAAESADTETPCEIAADELPQIGG